ncbi:MAG TPA: proton-conducting transporter membrane subunit [Acetobacteraceae bacterium]|nr:proton-conducting transporter membrane subunit [Acetobacteraceae bacterium]
MPAVLPIAVAALLLTLAGRLHRRLPDLVAIATAAAVMVIAALLARGSVAAPIAYWFGGWVPHGAQVLGVGFVVDPVGAAVAAFAALLFALTFVFAWGFFADTGTRFHVLALVFLGAIEGFSLTHDLFNLFVWFELMSVAAFALTAYALNISALEGALGFTVVNTLGSFFMLGGTGLIYARVGALDFAALARGVAPAGDDPVVLAAFCLIAMAMLIKGAIVPLHFWLADAHAVAPSPVSVIFSSIMVPLGLFGLARLLFAVFAASPAVQGVAHGMLVDLGALTAVVGGVMCILQRHVKRLLAFSTIAHMGVLVVGIASLSASGIAGSLAYLIGQGLVKGALFMVAGIMLALLGGVDEIRLRGAGRAIWPVGLACAIGGLLLGGAPLGVMDAGASLIDDAQAHHEILRTALAVGTGLTGAAVLRLAGRVFAGLGAHPGVERDGPTEEEREPAQRPLWLMFAPLLVMLGLALVPAHWAARWAAIAAGGFLLASGGTATIPHLPPTADVGAWTSLAIACGFAAFALLRHRAPHGLRAVLETASWPVSGLLLRIHSGIVGDYVAWVVAGLAVLAAGFALR